MDEQVNTKQLPACPNCGSTNTRKGSRRRTEELVLNRMKFQFPYRCQDCDHRFFALRASLPDKYAPPKRAYS
jgi:transposase-like protein